MRRSLVVALVVASLALASGSAEGRKDDKAEKDKAAKTKVYKTPQEVFDAFVAAEQKGDFKTWVSLMAPKARKEAAGTIGVIIGADRALLEADKDEKAKEFVKLFKPVFDVLDKHGLTNKALKEVKKSKDKKEMEKSRKIVTDALKDQDAFLVDVLTAMRKLGFDEKTKYELTDVKIDGDKAKGTVVKTTPTFSKDKKKEKVKKEPIEFVKSGGSWQIVPTFDLDDDDK
jgi:hypothetical protein